MGRRIRLGMSMGRQMDLSWEIDDLTPTQECGRGFSWEILNGPRLGGLGGDLVRNFEWV